NRIRPSCRKENIAGSLNLDQHIERGPDVLLRLSGPQRMVKVLQSFENPGFATPVVYIFKARKPGVPSLRIRRQSRHHELEECFPLGFVKERPEGIVKIAETELNILFRVFARQRSQSEIRKVCRSHSPIEHLFP